MSGELTTERTGLRGLRRSGAAGGGAIGAWGLAAAITGMSVLALVELVAISAARSSISEPRSALLNVLYGVASILTGLGLVLAGVAVRRARRWTGWRSWLVLALGVYVFVPLTPALAGPLSLARVAIVVWMVLFAVLGAVLADSGDRS